jgi:hypothetical protein
LKNAFGKTIKHLLLCPAPKGIPFRQTIIPSAPIRLLYFHQFITFFYLRQIKLEAFDFQSNKQLDIK